MNKRKIFCTCHLKPVKVVPNQRDSSKNDYLCPVTDKVLYRFNYKSKEKNMPDENLEDTRPGEEAELTKFPDEEESRDVPIFNEEGHSNEEPPEESFEEEKEGETGEVMEESEQPFLFEGDKVYNALHTALTDINDCLKRTNKKLDHTKVEKEVLLTRKKEIQEALEVYEKQRSEKE